jgi:hypothetical protein
MTRNGIFLTAVFGVAVVVAMGARQSSDLDGAETVRRIAGLSRSSVWKRVGAVRLGFAAFHPQGMVKIGNTFHMTSVDRTGLGYLFKFDGSGRLVARVKLGEGPMYHPGGIDYDGTSIWVSVAEYRPDSRTIVYRVDPGTMKASEVFRFGDHIGAIVHDTDDNTLHGVSWGSRRFYRWTMDAEGRVTNAGVPPAQLRTMNRSHYVDYQDCKYAGGHRMICTGVTELRRTQSAPPFRLGGIEVVNLADGRVEHQVPVNVWTSSGHVMTQNPVWIEPHGDGLRAYFVPEDDRATLYIYEVK